MLGGRIPSSWRVRIAALPRGRAAILFLFQLVLHLLRAMEDLCRNSPFAASEDSIWNCVLQEINSSSVGKRLNLRFGIIKGR